MIRVKEAVIVEGKYDKIKLSSLVDGVILETKGFGIFKDRERMELIRRLAASRGLVILTDSDGAGFLIRGKLTSCIPPEQIKNAYIPDLFGKERRKAEPSKEGKLGVEGMSLEVLRQALLRAGATVEEEAGEAARIGTASREKLTKADLFELGLSGRPDSAQKRRRLQKALDLPERLSANGLLQVLNALYGREEFWRLADAFREGENAAGQDGTEI